MITKLGKALAKDSTTLFHGSPLELPTLSPRDDHGDPDIPAVVFGTPYRTFALAYTGKKWGDRDIEQVFDTPENSSASPKMTLREMRPGAFKEIFDGQSGYLHHIKNRGFSPLSGRDGTDIEMISRRAVKPMRVERIENVLSALQKEPGVSMENFDGLIEETTNG